MLWRLLDERLTDEEKVAGSRVARAIHAFG
jgi:hypothetical protein